jgi:hypothetical protein
MLMYVYLYTLRLGSCPHESKQQAQNPKPARHFEITILASVRLCQSLALQYSTSGCLR